MGCARKLADGQYWGFCGETDMGQTAPVLCTNCGGSFKLAEAVITPELQELLDNTRPVQEVLDSLKDKYPIAIVNCHSELVIKDDEITALKRENEILRNALRAISTFGRMNSGCGYSCGKMADSALKRLSELL